MKKIILVLLSVLLLAACGGKEKKDLGYTSDDFISLFKSNASSELSIGDKEEKGDLSVIELHPGISMIFATNDEDIIILAGVGATSFARQSDGDILDYGIQAFLKSVDPSLSQAQLTSIYDKLRISDTKNLGDHKKNHVINGVKYSIESEEEGILILKAKPH